MKFTYVSSKKPFVYKNILYTNDVALPLKSWLVLFFTLSNPPNKRFVVLTSKTRHSASGFNTREPERAMLWSAIHNKIAFY